MPTQSRNWCFTDFELLDWERIYNECNDIIRYVCFGLEICPTTKKKHIQGWIQFVNKKRMGGVKKVCQCKKIHLEACLGTQEQNDKYCQKEGKYKQFGKYVKQGQRTDLENIYKKIKKGTSRSVIMDDHFATYCRNRNGINDAIEECQRKERSKFRHVETTFIHGATGTGKTRFVMDKYPNCFKIEGSELQWFDGYDGEKVLLIDEYANDIKITKLLNILDGYRLRLAIKGGHTFANWNKVFITSNLNPEELHERARQMHRDALWRRIDKKMLFKDVLK